MLRRAPAGLPAQPAHRASDEHSGTSILDVSNPAKPVLVAHIPSAPDANCRAVQVIESPRDGKRYLARNHESKAACSFQIFDITDRAKPKMVADVKETPAGPMRIAHKGWWDQESGLYFGCANEPGFRPGGHLVIWDFSNPRGAAGTSPTTGCPASC